MTKPSVSIIIPTLRRPESLMRAVRSAYGQLGVSDRLQDIIVVDNDPEASARDICRKLSDETTVPILWCHAPKPGVATARNRGLAETRAPLIAFLDDDEEASPRWLSALIKAREQLDADAVFGPIQGQVPAGTGPATAYLERFFGRQGSERTQVVGQPYGCGNSLLLRATALPGDAPFNTSADQSGGEDDLLFAALAQRGGRFGWAADAWVKEYAPEHRATLAYALSRAFAYGQGPSQTAAAAHDWPALARWMLIGAGQAVVYGLGSALLGLIRHPGRLGMYDRAVRGAGKLFWTKKFEPHFYGAHELSRLNRQARRITPSDV